MYAWKQRNGSKATYSELMEIFKRAGYRSYADEVKRIAELSDSEADDSSGSEEGQPRTYPTLPKAEAFSCDQHPPENYPEVYVMVEKKEGKTLYRASTCGDLSVAAL